MQINIKLDDQLLNEAMKAGSFKTKKEAINEGLKLLIGREKQRKILKYRGKITMGREA